MMPTIPPATSGTIFVNNSVDMYVPRESLKAYEDVNTRYCYYYYNGYYRVINIIGYDYD